MTVEEILKNLAVELVQRDIPFRHVEQAFTVVDFDAQHEVPVRADLEPWAKRVCALLVKRVEPSSNRIAELEERLSETMSALDQSEVPSRGSTADRVRTLASEAKALKARITALEGMVSNAISVAVKYGGIDGAHHKTWVIDQMVRALAPVDYDAIVAMACDGEDGPNTYEWDEGTPP